MTHAASLIPETDPRWQAVCARVREAGFFYGVTTTGIYCRPACPARRPRLENVAFFDTCAAAEAAGLRACLRCRPREDDRQAAVVAQACRHIETAEQMPDLDALAQEAGLSRFHFHRLFRQLTGCTPRAYGRALREQRVRDGLQGEGSVTKALYDAGYGSGGRFYEAAPAVLGMRPGRYKKGGAGEAIRFAVGQCRLGAILVAESEQGLCAIALGDDPEVLVRDLQDRFPAAQLMGDDPVFAAKLAQVVGLIEMPGVGLNLPLDIRGTAFQQRVWQALRAIPPGQTASYAEVAARIGAPAAVRAVAGACAANTLAVAIPCHRVVRSDGALSGYRWGVARKRALLDQERAD
ncbi:bifunctional DNA-binding transcriptional regulator/O6-methylguanine-DNA methyltransferase Ada [Asticcacaulis sp. EMRT-3]|uniref:bifunctional DNA-binding transcriptional regulator/O6-methylguanine-DNA methyltransferase Ada n=1 Tax=Asticcacaulis sp. EMRT-3 TaxID=3040349 RepID=UPI0024AFA909|nr:bifunctional DNA-binding transcriptional regulator/O6-methylguanine-DNA methyltransferase Ada [Asticcacaulis sp. EMRT-3]MDI7775065.1 bifunctional DNA-binding transcriptional regulator/O6-methylguanine-DNA methyltransferase Ada [Asticcacaulis sp. EMRT-3]